MKNHRKAEGINEKTENKKETKQTNKQMVCMHTHTYKEAACVIDYMGSFYRCFLF